MKKSIMLQVSNNVRKIRKAKKMTSCELARAVGVAESTIFAIENRTITPTDEIVEKLLKVLDKPLKKVFYF